MIWAKAATRWALCQYLRLFRLRSLAILFQRWRSGRSNMPSKKLAFSLRALSSLWVEASIAWHLYRHHPFYSSPSWAPDGKLERRSSRHVESTSSWTHTCWEETMSGRGQHWQYPHLGLSSRQAQRTFLLGDTKYLDGHRRCQRLTRPCTTLHTEDKPVASCVEINSFLQNSDICELSVLMDGFCQSTLWFYTAISIEFSIGAGNLQLVDRFLRR